MVDLVVDKKECQSDAYSHSLTNVRTYISFTASQLGKHKHLPKSDKPLEVRGM